MFSKIKSYVLAASIAACLTGASFADPLPENGDPAACDNGTIKIDIIHVNDMHGHVDCLIDDTVAKGPVGGIAYVKTLVDKLRAENPKGTIVLNAGDLAEGTMISYLSKGISYCKAMHTFNFDAVALGNHDFAWDQPALKAMMEALDAPILTANIQKTANGECLDGGVPYMIKEVEGVKIGIIGLDTPNIRHFIHGPKLRGLEFRDGIETVKWYLPLMRKGGAEIILVLSHMGYEPDIELAKAVPEIDIIVGGHSHTVLQHGDKVGDTVIVQAGSLTKYVGKLEIEVDAKDHKILTAEASLIPVASAKIEPDPEVMAVLKPYLEEAAIVGAKPYGEALEDVHFAHREAAKLNQIHADSILEKTGADFVICNSRSLRGNIKKGKITYTDVYSALPFTEENYVTMYITGQQVLDEIEDDLRDKATELAVPAGLSYEYDPKRPEGHRVTKITLANGEALDPAKVYFVALNETMSRKKFFNNSRDKIVYGCVQPLFFEAIKRQSPLKDNPDDRVKRL